MRKRVPIDVLEDVNDLVVGDELVPEVGVVEDALEVGIGANATQRDLDDVTAGVMGDRFDRGSLTINKI